MKKSNLYLPCSDNTPRQRGVSPSEAALNISPSKQEKSLTKHQFGQETGKFGIQFIYIYINKLFHGDLRILGDNKLHEAALARFKIGLKLWKLLQYGTLSIKCYWYNNMFPNQQYFNNEHRCAQISGERKLAHLLFDFKTVVQWRTLHLMTRTVGLVPETVAFLWAVSYCPCVWVLSWFSGCFPQPKCMSGDSGTLKRLLVWIQVPVVVSISMWRRDKYGVYSYFGKRHLG